MIATLTILGCGSMKQDTIEDFKRKHLENYKNAVLETLKNNTTALFDDDIFSLLQKPPLDSMDLIKCKFLDVAKKYKVVVKTEVLNQILDDYRSSAVTLLSDWKKLRIKELNKIIEEFQPKKETDVIKFNKKDFVPFNRKLKKAMKEKFLVVINKKIVNNVNQLFTKETDIKIKESMILEITKYVQGSYLKQLLESIDFKIIVKDTTLMNGVREQGERFIFTKMNSYLLNEDKISE